jgi:hypothetical protein
VSGHGMPRPSRAPRRLSPAARGIRRGKPCRGDPGCAASQGLPSACVKRAWPDAHKP